MFGPAPIELGTLPFCQLQFGVSFGVSEAIPESHCELGTVTGREFEQLGKRARWHNRMVSRWAVFRQTPGLLVSNRSAV